MAPAPAKEIARGPHIAGHRRREVGIAGFVQERFALRLHPAGGKGHLLCARRVALIGQGARIDGVENQKRLIGLAFVQRLSDFLWQRGLWPAFLNLVRRERLFIHQGIRQAVRAIGAHEPPGHHRFVMRAAPAGFRLVDPKRDFIGDHAARAEDPPIHRHFRRFGIEHTIRKIGEHQVARLFIPFLHGVIGLVLFAAHGTPLLRGTHAVGGNEVGEHLARELRGGIKHRAVLSLAWAALGENARTGRRAKRRHLFAMTPMRGGRGLQDLVAFTESFGVSGHGVPVRVRASKRSGLSANAHKGIRRSGDSAPQEYHSR